MQQIHFYTATENRVKINQLISGINIRIVQYRSQLIGKIYIFTDSFSYWFELFIITVKNLSQCVSIVHTQRHRRADAARWQKSGPVVYILLIQQAKTNRIKFCWRLVRSPGIEFQVGTVFQFQLLRFFGNQSHFYILSIQKSTKAIPVLHINLPQCKT